MDYRNNIPPTGSQGYGFEDPSQQQGAPRASQPPRNPYGLAGKIAAKLDDYVTDRAERNVNYVTGMNAYLEGRRQHMDSQAGAYYQPSHPHGYQAYPPAPGTPPHASAMRSPEDPMTREVRQLFDHILTRFADLEQLVHQRLSAMEARLDNLGSAGTPRPPKLPPRPDARRAHVADASIHAEETEHHAPPSRIRRKPVAPPPLPPRSKTPPPLPPRVGTLAAEVADEPRERDADWDRRSNATSVSEHDVEDDRWSDAGSSDTRRRRPPPPPPPKLAHLQPAGNAPGLAAGTDDHIRNQLGTDFARVLQANMQAETQTMDEGRRHAVRLTH